MNTVCYEYGASLFKNRFDWGLAMVSDWLTAGGSNNPWQVRRFLAEQSDSELALEFIQDGWTQPMETEYPERQPASLTFDEINAAIAYLRKKYERVDDDAA